MVNSERHGYTGLGIGSFNRAKCTVLPMAQRVGHKIAAFVVLQELVVNNKKPRLSAGFLMFKCVSLYPGKRREAYAVTAISQQTALPFV